MDFRTITELQQEIDDPAPALEARVKELEGENEILLCSERARRVLLGVVASQGATIAELNVALDVAYTALRQYADKSNWYSHECTAGPLINNKFYSFNCCDLESDEAEKALKKMDEAKRRASR